MAKALSQRSIGVGLLGLGVVGTGVARTLAEKSDSIARRVGCPIELRRVLVRDAQRERPLAGLALTTDPEAVLCDPNVRIVVEVMGGEEPARTFLERAIAAGKHVVTANKEVMAKHGAELVSAAAVAGVDVAYEASVGGGIPVIGPFKLDLLANDISQVTAIINGTTNYIITRMSQAGLDFAAALREAQEAGYAEPDPRNDVEGIDAAYKLAILATLAFHARVRPEDVHCEGITSLSPSDFRYAHELGYAIKLLAIGKQTETGLELRVHPTMLPTSSMLANVDGVFNAVQVDGDLQRGSCRRHRSCAAVGGRRSRSGAGPNVRRPPNSTAERRLHPLLLPSGGRRPPRRHCVCRQRLRRAPDQPSVRHSKGRRARRGTRWRRWQVRRDRVHDP
jgi:homoserine dehydrogenase